MFHLIECRKFGRIRSLARVLQYRGCFACNQISFSPVLSRKDRHTGANGVSRLIKPSFSQESYMQDVYEVLRAKEILIEQVAREIEALRLVAPLLSDDTDSGSRPPMRQVFGGSRTP